MARAGSSRSGRPAPGVAGTRAPAATGGGRRRVGMAGPGGGARIEAYPDHRRGRAHVPAEGHGARAPEQGLPAPAGRGAVVRRRSPTRGLGPAPAPDPLAHASAPALRPLERPPAGPVVAGHPGAGRMVLLRGARAAPRRLPVAEARARGGPDGVDHAPGSGWLKRLDRRPSRRGRPSPGARWLAWRRWRWPPTC